MTRAMRITFLAAAVLGLLSGTIFGYYEAKEVSGFMQEAEVMAIASADSDFSREQFDHADNTRAREAVMLEIGNLEQLERIGHDSYAEGKLGYAYTRLAMIEAAAGDAAAEHRALDRARSWFQRVHPRSELTDEQMKDALKRIDSVIRKL